MQPIIWWQKAGMRTNKGMAERQESSFFVAALGALLWLLIFMACVNGLNITLLVAVGWQQKR